MHDDEKTFSHIAEVDQRISLAYEGVISISKFNNYSFFRIECYRNIIIGSDLLSLRISSRNKNARNDLLIKEIRLIEKLVVFIRRLNDDY